MIFARKKAEMTDAARALPGRPSAIPPPATTSSTETRLRGHTLPVPNRSSWPWAATGEPSANSGSFPAAG